jgi:hypothetical protein
MSPFPPDTFARTILAPGIEFSGITRQRPQAATFLLAVAIQETGLLERAQRLGTGAPGPARGWWQFEMPTIGLLLAHATASPILAGLAQRVRVRPQAEDIWRAIEGHDALACAVARLLLLTDRLPIPTDEEAAWECYARRLWRPGKPHRARWRETAWPQAVATLPLP